MTCHRHLPVSLATKGEIDDAFVVLYVSSPLTLTVWVNAGVEAHVAYDGLNTANTMVPPAPVVVPVSVPEASGTTLWAVDRLGWFLSMTIVSDVHALVALLLFASPVYAAWK